MTDRRQKICRTLGEDWKGGQGLSAQTLLGLFVASSSRGDGVGPSEMGVFSGKRRRDAFVDSVLCFA